MTKVRTQTLSSGLVIRQDFRSAVRFAMYETGVVGYDYATHGGTIFIVVFRGKPFGITCAHIRGDFEWRNLVVTDTKFGQLIAGLKGVYYPSQPVGHAVDSDVLDLLVVEFAGDVGPAFFHDTAYVFDPGTIASSASGERLEVNGAFKAESCIGDTIAPVFGLLEFEDAGPYQSDVVLRKAIARYEKPEFDALTGLSGSPVFNATKGRLAGVMLRGGMDGDDATMHYIDVTHVSAVLEAIANDWPGTNYRFAVPP